MRQRIDADYFTDAKGNPCGGHTASMGLLISWQDGPLIDPQWGEPLAPNGCFVQTVIDAAIDRLRFHNRTQFACAANDEALEYLRRANAVLDRRQREREERGVAGTHKV